MTNVLAYFRCFYLTFVLIFLLLAYHQYLNLRPKHTIYENVGIEDEIDAKKRRVYNVNEVASDIEVRLEASNLFKSSKLIQTLIIQSK